MASHGTSVESNETASNIRQNLITARVEWQNGNRHKMDTAHIYVVSRNTHEMINDNRNGTEASHKYELTAKDQMTRNLKAIVIRNNETEYKLCNKLRNRIMT